MSVRLGLHTEAPCALLEGFKSRALRGLTTTARDLYSIAWCSLDARRAAASSGVLVVGGCATRLRLLERVGSVAEVWSHGGVTSVAAVGATQRGLCAMDSVNALELAVALVQTQAVRASTAVWLVTTIAQGSLGSAHGGWWGLARSARSEEPQLPLRCVDASVATAMSRGRSLAEGEGEISCVITRCWCLV